MHASEKDCSFGLQNVIRTLMLEMPFNLTIERTNLAVVYVHILHVFSRLLNAYDSTHPLSSKLKSRDIKKW